MYPRADVELHPELPANAEFWTPTPEDIDEEEGFGYFRDVWAILDVTVEHAQNVESQDRHLCALVAGLATNETEFEILASVLETASGEDEEEITGEQLAVLVDHFPGAEALEGLELGVAGLVYALAAAGMYPAASCRGHSDPGAWSPSPVVLFVADQSHAEVLQPLVRESRCGFALDSVRRDFLAIVSASIEEMLLLAQDILDNAANFRSLDQPHSL